MSKFPDYYNSEIKRLGGIVSYIKEKANEKKPLLDRVSFYARRRRRILEAGCGSSVNSIYLANNGYNLYCIDNDPKMIRMAKHNASNFKRKPRFSVSNILKTGFSNGYFDVVFSHGVLEHFTDKEIIRLINAELRISDFVVLSVPSNFFRKEEAINGDERFLSKEHWKILIKKSNGKLIESFSYFYKSDELRIKILRRIHDITGGIFPLRKPYLGFVIKNES